MTCWNLTAVYISTPPCGQIWVLHVLFCMTPMSWRWLGCCWCCCCCAGCERGGCGALQRGSAVPDPLLCASSRQQHLRAEGVRAAEVRDPGGCRRRRGRGGKRFPAAAAALLAIHLPGHFLGRPRATTALRSPPTWLTSESASPAPSAPSANTSFSICSRTPATGRN